jgi:uncharacterized protein (UPF0303 family)
MTFAEALKAMRQGRRCINIERAKREDHYYYAVDGVVADNHGWKCRKRDIVAALKSTRDAWAVCDNNQWPQ